MTKYIKNHTAYILEQIAKNNVTEQLHFYHRLQIENIQHERLIHLIVLCLFTLLFIGTVILLVFLGSLAFMLLFVIFLIVEIFYVLHYYLLENTVQRWYELENDILSTLKNIGANTSEK